MLHSIINQIEFLAMGMTCLFAFAKGGFVEKAAAVLVSINWVLSLGLSVVLAGLFSRQIEELTFLGVDALTAIGLLILALRFANIWLGVAMLVQSGALALHGAVMGDWGLGFRNYMIFNNLLSLGLLALLICATAAAWLGRSRRRANLPADAGVAHA